MGGSSGGGRSEPGLGRHQDAAGRDAIVVEAAQILRQRFTRLGLQGRNLVAEGHALKRKGDGVVSRCAGSGEREKSFPRFDGDRLQTGGLEDVREVVGVLEGERSRRPGIAARISAPDDVRLRRPVDPPLVASGRSQLPDCL